MLQTEIEDALNTQLNHELAAAHQYLAIAAYFTRQSLAGFATFMLKQAEEEREHARRFIDYVHDRSGTVRLGAIPEPTLEFGSPKAAFEAAHEYERANTRGIHAVYALARAADDYATQTMLNWFVDEQVEEEAWCEEAVQLLEMAGDNRSALLMLDKRYGEREEGA